MNKIRVYIICLCLALWASALSAQTHWSFNYRQYQYDMTVYFSLQKGNRAVANTSDYEVAAFVGNECRGIGSFEQQTGTNGQQVSYGFLKVYSNSQRGETVTFKVYNKVNGEETVFEEDVIPFVSTTAVGYPSEPFVLNMGGDILPGDADGDGRITINDAVLTINATFGTEPTGFNRIAADMDSDGRVTINDAVLIINLTF